MNVQSLLKKRVTSFFIIFVQKMLESYSSEQFWFKKNKKSKYDAVDERHDCTGGKQWRSLRGKH